MLQVFSTLIIAAAQPVYSLDGTSLGSTIASVIQKRGVPQASGGATYTWRNQVGGNFTVVTDEYGIVKMIDVIAGPNERRNLTLPYAIGVTGVTDHVNLPPPRGANLEDECGAGLVGAPCEAYTLRGGLEFVVNFGKENGMADWGLSEAILGDRDTLARCGRIVKHAIRGEIRR